MARRPLRPSNPARPRVNIDEVARMAGVSKATVSRYLNGRDIRSPGRERLTAAIARLGYAPSRLAQGLKSRRTTTLALVLPDITNPFFPALVKGAEDAARAAGFHLLVANAGEDPGLQWERLQGLSRLRVDGYLLVPAPGDDETLPRRLASLQAPVVFVDRAPAHEADLVTADNVRGGVEATRHLVRLGNKRIAFVAPVRASSVHRDRETGFMQALAAAGIKADPRGIARTPSTVSDGAAAVQQLLDIKNRPTAVVASTNRLAIGAVSAIHKRGLVCPDDVAVVGFDDHEWEDIFRPRLTTIAQPTYLMGQRAAELLLARIREGGPAAATRIVLDMELVVRESCGVYRS